MDPDLERLSAEWLNEIGGQRRHEKNTRNALTHALKRFWQALRDATDTPASQGLPASLFHKTNIRRAQARLVEQDYSVGTVYQTVHPVVCDFWLWAADENIPSLPRPPRQVKDLLPPNPHYEPPPRTPTFDEIDEMLRRIRCARALAACILMRGTGLRIDQVAPIHANHFDLDQNTLLIIRGKSRWRRPR